MKEMEIYNNGSSRCSVRFDGEIVYLEQEIDGVVQNSIYLYEEEFEEAYVFIKSGVAKA